MSEFENNQIPQAPVEPQAPAAPAAPAAPQAAFNLPQVGQNNVVDTAKGAAEKILKNPNLPKIVIGAVAAVVVVLIASALFGKGYEKPVDKYMDLFYKGKTQYAEDLIPAAVLEYYAEEEDEDADALLEEIVEEHEESYEYLNDEYGDLEKLDYEITKAKKLKENKLEDLAEAIEDNYDCIDADDVKKAYKLTIKGEAEFEEDDIELDRKLYSVKIDGKWYLVSENGNFIF